MNRSQNDEGYEHERIGRPPRTLEASESLERILLYSALGLWLISLAKLLDIERNLEALSMRATCNVRTPEPRSQMQQMNMIERVRGSNID